MDWNGMTISATQPSSTMLALARQIVFHSSRKELLFSTSASARAPFGLTPKK